MTNTMINTSKTLSTGINCYLPCRDRTIRKIHKLRTMSSIAGRKSDPFTRHMLYLRTVNPKEFNKQIILKHGKVLRKTPIHNNNLRSFSTLKDDLNNNQLYIDNEDYQTNPEKGKVHLFNETLSVNKNERTNRVSLLLRKLQNRLFEDGYKCNNQTQMIIEEYAFNNFSLLGSRQKYQNVEGYDNIPSKVNEYILSKHDILDAYINSFLKSLRDRKEMSEDINSLIKKIALKRKITDTSNLVEDILNHRLTSDNIKSDNKIKSDEVKKRKGRITKAEQELHKSIFNNLMLEILESISIEMVKGACIYIFYTCLTYWDSAYRDEDDINNTSIENLTLVPIVTKIGRELINKYIYIKYVKDTEHIENKDDRPSFTHWKDSFINVGYNSYLFRDDFRAEFGSQLIEILEWSGLVKKVLYTFKYDSKKYVVDLVDRDLLEELAMNRIVYNLPLNLPMVVKPKPYTKYKLGGYLLNGNKYNEDIFIKKTDYEKTSEITNSSVIYDLVNGISAVPYKINTEVLDFISKNTDLNLIYDIHKPHKYQNIKRNKLQNSAYKTYVGQLLNQEITLDIASVFRNFSKFYLPVRLDQRGRMYCSPPYLSYQGTDLAKSLLLFATPEIIQRDSDCVDYIKAYGANLFGTTLSKKSIQFKCKWVNNNLNDIINYHNGKLIRQAKSPLLFLSFCIEYKRIYETFQNADNMEFNTYLPIEVDATCNGFQHMALLSNEERLFRRVNLRTNSNISSKNHEPSDFYSYILDKIMSVILIKVQTNEFGKNDKLRDTYHRLNNFIWNRTNVKKAIMTIPYNATMRTMTVAISKSLGEPVKIENENTKEEIRWYGDLDTNILVNDYDICILVTLIYKIIYENHDRIKKLVKYLKNIASLHNKLNAPIIWTLPSGLIISQSYLETSSLTITPFTHKNINLTLKVSNKGEMDKKRQRRAFMPNLIHSLDGASLALLYNKFVKSTNNSPFFAIHDCFGVTASKIELIKILLLSVYIELYSEPKYLKSFDEYILYNITKITTAKVEGRVVTYDGNKKHTLESIDWVLDDNASPIKLNHELLAI